MLLFRIKKNYPINRKISSFKTEFINQFKNDDRFKIRNELDIEKDKFVISRRENGFNIFTGYSKIVEVRGIIVNDQIRCIIGGTVFFEIGVIIMTLLLFLFVLIAITSTNGNLISLLFLLMSIPIYLILNSTIKNLSKNMEKEIDQVLRYF